jgi:hypothetical protein
VLRPQVGGRGGEDLEALGGAIDAGWHREAVGPGLERAAITLVRDDRVRVAELPARARPVPSNAQCSGRCTV